MKVKANIVSIKEVEVPDKFDEFIDAMKHYPIEGLPSEDYKKFWQRWEEISNEFDAEVAKVAGVPLASSVNSPPYIVSISTEDDTLLSEF